MVNDPRQRHARDTAESVLYSDVWAAGREGLMTGGNMRGKLMGNEPRNINTWGQKADRINVIHASTDAKVRR